MMMTYLLLLNLYLLIFYGFYHFFLRKHTFFHWNRAYLLLGLFLACLLPKANYDLGSSVAVYQQYLPLMQAAEPEVLLGGDPVVATVGSASIDWQQVFFYLYLIGCGIAFCIFLLDAVKLIRLLRTQATGQAYSFFNIIRVDRQVSNWEEMDRHEQVHARQWHTLDILLIQLLKIVCWFNPAVYRYERELKLQHEYLADRETGADNRYEYAELLVYHAIGTSRSQAIVHQFSNKALLKQRIKMLMSMTTPKTRLLRFVFVIPMTSLLLMCSVLMNQDGKVTAAELPIFSKNIDANAFRSLLGSNIRFTDRAIEAGVGKALYVAFTKTDQRISEVQYLNEYGYGQEEEVSRVLQFDKVVAAAPEGKFIVPIHFEVSGYEPIKTEVAIGEAWSSHQQLPQITIIAYQPIKEAPAPKLRPSASATSRAGGGEQAATEVPAPKQPQTIGQTVVIQENPPVLQDTLIASKGMETPPEPHGGINAFRTWIGNNYRYPKEAMDAGVNGSIEISFVVEKDGSITDVKYIRDLGYGTGEEAVRLMQRAAKWKPGMQNGKPVRVAYTLPIRLNLSQN